MPETLSFMWSGWGNVTMFNENNESSTWRVRAESPLCKSMKLVSLAFPPRFCALSSFSSPFPALQTSDPCPLPQLLPVLSSAPCSWNLKWHDGLRGHRLPPAINTQNCTWNVSAEVLFMPKLKRKSLLQILWTKTSASVLQRKMDRDSGSRGWELGVQCLQDGGLGLRPQHKTWTTARIPSLWKGGFKTELERKPGISLGSLRNQSFDHVLLCRRLEDLSLHCSSSEKKTFSQKSNCNTGAKPGKFPWPQQKQMQTLWKDASSILSTWAVLAK